MTDWALGLNEMVVLTDSNYDQLVTKTNDPYFIKFTGKFQL